MRTQDEILSEYIATVSEIDTDIDTEVQRKMFQDLKNVDGFLDWLDKIIASDLRKYFDAPSQRHQDVIRGNITRTVDMKKRTIESDKPIVTKKVSIPYRK